MQVVDIRAFSIVFATYFVCLLDQNIPKYPEPTEEIFERRELLWDRYIISFAVMYKFYKFYFKIDERNGSIGYSRKTQSVPPARKDTWLSTVSFCRAIQ